MTYKDSSDNFSTHWISSVDEISNTEWERIIGKNIIKSKAFFQAIERSCFREVKYYYLIVYKCKIIVAIVPCFYYSIDLFNLMISSKTKSMIKNIRKICPKFLKIKAFVTGTYAASCEHFIEYASDITPEDFAFVRHLVNQELKKKCNDVGSKFIFVKDVRERDINKVKQRLNEDFYFFISFPSTAIPIIPNITYPSALRKKNRKRYRNFKEKFDTNFRWEIVYDFNNYIDQLTELYFSVLNKAKNKFEILNANFFRQINNLFFEKSYLLIARDNNGEIRLMELILEDQDRLYPLYLGIKYKKDDTKVLYLNTIFRTVKEAEKKNKDFVDFGQTSYYPKVMSGALVENIYYGFWSDHVLFKWLIKNAFPIFFLPPEIPKHVYLDQYKNEAYKVLAKKGFHSL